MEKMIIPISFVVAFSMIFGFQDAAAMTVIWGDDPPLDANFVCTIVGTNDFCADDFELQMLVSVGDAHFWIDEPGLLNDNVYDWQILSDSAGTPISPPIASGTGIISMQPMLAPGVCADFCYEVWIDIVPPVQLGPGTYWLAISDKPEYNLVIDENEPATDEVAVDFDDLGIWALFESHDFPLLITWNIVVGGEFLPIETTALLLAAAQSPASWLTSLTIAALGIGAYVFTRNPSNMRNIKVILRDYLDRL